MGCPGIKIVELNLRFERTFPKSKGKEDYRYEVLGETIMAKIDHEQQDGWSVVILEWGLYHHYLNRDPASNNVH